MIVSVTFRAKYLTDLVYQCSSLRNFSLVKNNILHRSKNYKNHFLISGVGHVTYSFINMLFISTGIFNDKLHPQILSVGTTTNATLSCEFELDTTLCDKVYQ